jgi:hypothetical protein
MLWKTISGPINPPSGDFLTHELTHSDLQMGVNKESIIAARDLTEIADILYQYL